LANSCATAHHGSSLSDIISVTAGEMGLPVLMHVSSRAGGLYGVIDDLHLRG